MQDTSMTRPRKTMQGHADWVQGVIHLPGGKRIMTCSRDGSLRVWEIENGAQIGNDWRDEGDNAAVITIALSPNGQTVASGSGNGTVRLWDVETRKVIARWKGHTRYVWSVCWSPDGGQVVSGSPDGTVRVWDVKSNQTVLGPIDSGHQRVYAVMYSSDATKIATGGYNKNAIKIWDAKTGELISTIEHDLPVWTLAWTSDGKKLISGSWDRSIRIFDSATWRQIAILEGHQERVRAITLSRNDRLLASTSWDNTARLWNLDTNLPVGPPLQHEDEVNCAAISADGKLLATGCDDKNAHVWDIEVILKVLDLEDLLSPFDVPKGGLKQKSLFDADATRHPTQLEDAQRLPPGFFNCTQDHIYSSATHGTHHHPGVRHRLTSSLGAHALLGHLSSFFRHSHPIGHDAIEPRQRPRQGFISRPRPNVVEVAAVHDKRSLYVAPPRNKKSKTQGVQTQGQHRAQTSSSRPKATVAAGILPTPMTSTVTTTANATPATSMPSHPAVVVNNPPLRIRAMLFICCASVDYTDGHH